MCCALTGTNLGDLFSGEMASGVVANIVGLCMHYKQCAQLAIKVLCGGEVVNNGRGLS